MQTNLNWRRMLRHSVRVYFAPLSGAFKGIRDEYRRLALENTRARKAERLIAIGAQARIHHP